MFGVAAESFLRCPVPVPPRFGRKGSTSKLQQETRRQKKKRKDWQVLDRLKHTPPPQKKNKWWRGWIETSLYFVFP